MVSQSFCWWARVGLPPGFWVALEVHDRESGRIRADAVVVPTVAGQRYIVSMFGTISDWVQNLEAAHGDAVIIHRGSQRVRLVLLPPEERAPILQEYARVASSGRKHSPLPVGLSLTDFAAIAAQYPIYRIEVHGRRRMALTAPLRPMTTTGAARFTYGLPGPSVCTHVRCSSWTRGARCRISGDMERLTSGRASTFRSVRP